MRDRAHPLRRPALALVATAAALCAISCVHDSDLVRKGPGVSPSPGEAWTPPPEATAPAEAAPGEAPAAPAIPEDLLKSGAHWTLSDLVDLALRSSTVTHAAWANARSAAAGLGAQKGSYYPTVAGRINESWVRGSAVGGQFTFHSESTNPYIALSWLLFDFGGRTASVESARQTLIAADWSHNQAIQDVILEVEQAYYQYLSARALETAQKSAVDEAQTSLDAAEHRRESGVATIADVLQAKTRLSQARLRYQTVQGQVRTIEGALATSVGLPANIHLEVEIPTPEVPHDRAAIQIEDAIREAQERRPDLAAARARAEKAEADVRATHAQDRPSLSLTANQGRLYYDAFSIYSNTSATSLLLSIPIFNGFTYQYNLLKARADRDAAKENLEALRQAVTLQVWTSYFNHKTADQNVETTKDLVDSAKQSYDVASARYDAGAGTILDLLTAQSALEDARAQEVGARTSWFLTLAQLAHDTGTLMESAPAGKPDPSPEATP